MKRFVRLFATVLLIASTLLAQDLLAQSTVGSIYGHVTDSSGSILQGAQVELQPTSVIVVTDARGRGHQPATHRRQRNSGSHQRSDYQPAEREHGGRPRPSAERYARARRR